MPLSEANFRKTIERLLTSPLTLREIMRRLKLKGDQRAQTRERIRALAADGFIVHIRGARYGLPEKMNLVTGVVQGHRDGYGFVIPGNAALPDVFIGARNFDEAMHGDRVVCRVESRRADGRAEGRVIRVLDRAHETLAGRFQEARGAGFVTPFETRIVQELFIPPGKTQGARDGQAVVARILEHPAKQRQAQGEIIRVLGDPEDPSVELAIVTARYHLRAEFPPAALTEAAA
ncbi:MAG: ribonuclease R, partial [Nitrospinae bacterium]|nr:ribonuclease R [Nitrospinota bacterium]